MCRWARCVSEGRPDDIGDLLRVVYVPGRGLSAPHPHWHHDLPQAPPHSKCTLSLSFPRPTQSDHPLPPVLPASAQWLRKGDWRGENIFASWCSIVATGGSHNDSSRGGAFTKSPASENAPTQHRGYTPDGESSWERSLRLVAEGLAGSLTQ